MILACAFGSFWIATETHAEAFAAGQGSEPAPQIEVFDRVYDIVRPYPGEYAWRDEIPWQTRIQKARELAVAQDKPIFMLASANAYALGRT